MRRRAGIVQLPHQKGYYLVHDEHGEGQSCNQGCYYQRTLWARVKGELRYWWLHRTR